MLRLIKIIFLNLIIISILFGQTNFRDTQLQYLKVRQAFSEKEALLKDLFKINKLEWNNFEILLRGFKNERKLAVWIRNKNDSSRFQYLKKYEFAGFCGNLGPKRVAGDHQIPEGFYFINHYNPESDYFLSLGLNYPNMSDKLLGHKTNPGNSIYIHGSDVTIGCIPITDECIKELYVLAVQARQNGQNKIQVHLFPFIMNEKNMARFSEIFKNNDTLINFWKNLKKGYDYFSLNFTSPKISINVKGEYNFE